MQVRGKALHTTSRGLVVQAGQSPKQGQTALDSAGRRIGRVFDIFGPVKSPYAVIRPASGVSMTDLRKLIGSDIFMEDRYGKSREAKNVPRMRKHKARA